MTVLEALQATVESIKTWIENNFLNKKNIDSAPSTTSTNPVQNKVVKSEIDDLKTLVKDIDASETTSCWSDESKRLLITILRATAPEDQISNIDALETELFSESTSDATTTAILGSGVLGKIILGRSA